MVDEAEVQILVSSDRVSYVGGTERNWEQSVEAQDPSCTQYAVFA
jgi:hypothetical protein